MTTEEILAMYKAKAVEQARQQGRAEEMHNSLRAVYQARFGAPPRTIAAALARTHDPAVLQAWLPLFVTGSVEAIAAAVKPAKAAAAPRPRRAPARRR